MGIPVFMYHAFFDDKNDLKSADPHYAISFSEFKSHIDICIKNNYSVKSILDIITSDFNEKLICSFTFDDGHNSNYKAAQYLSENGFTGDFFINTNNINKDGFLSKEQLTKMSSMGMSIQSHSHDHIYIEDLQTDEACFQLNTSKNIIHEIINKYPQIYCPPGGRINSKIEKMAKDIGYIAIANSRPGIWTRNNSLMRIPRLPILMSITTDTFEGWLLQKTSSISKLKIKYAVTKIIKKTLGNKKYELLRELILSKLNKKAMNDCG